MPLPYRLSKHATLTLQRTPSTLLSAPPLSQQELLQGRKGEIHAVRTLPVDNKSRQPSRYAGAQSSTCLLLEKCVTGARGAPWDHMVPAPVPRAAREPWVAGACAEPSVPGKKAGAKGGGDWQSEILLPRERSRAHVSLLCVWVLRFSPSPTYFLTATSLPLGLLHQELQIRYPAALRSRRAVAPGALQRPDPPCYLLARTAAG